MELAEIKEIKELTSIEEVNEYLETGEWTVLSIASGVDEKQRPIHLYSIGRHTSNNDNTVWI